jgi:hypothetical protein
VFDGHLSLALGDPSGGHNRLLIGWQSPIRDALSEGKARLEKAGHAG